MYDRKILFKMVVFTVNFSVIIYDLGLASLALHLDLMSSHSTQRIIRSEWRQLYVRGPRSGPA